MTPSNSTFSFNTTANTQSQPTLGAFGSAQSQQQHQQTVGGFGSSNLFSLNQQPQQQR